MRKPWGCCLQYAPSSLYLADAAGCPGQPCSRSSSFRVSAPDTLSPLGLNTTCPLSVNKTEGNSRRRKVRVQRLREPAFSCAKPCNCRDPLIDTRARFPLWVVGHMFTWWDARAKRTSSPDRAYPRLYQYSCSWCVYKLLIRFDPLLQHSTQTTQQH
jgi:hypothetical protein